MPVHHVKRLTPESIKFISDCDLDAGIAYADGVQTIGIVMRSPSGEVLAALTMPFDDAHEFARGILEIHPEPQNPNLD